ncbi:hypothetical protein [Tepidibacillus decaturensis]|uniref:Uncharacterized protein n=1 Tax=Tepidibacillus decaturensis TaxID=1413211 RepID=A0A135L1Q9_9BACI|nr:hypothetical protein [Tepidibacillus decaturensis]KXG42890.1 hypothetical protein U473_01720 [Tepidibacillus decaturensis]
MNTQFDTLETKASYLQSDVTDIKATVQRIEESNPEDVHAMLQTINNKLDQRDADIQVLNKRVFNYRRFRSKSEFADIGFFHGGA